MFFFSFKLIWRWEKWYFSVRWKKSLTFFDEHTHTHEMNKRRKCILRKDKFSLVMIAKRWTQKQQWHTHEQSIARKIWLSLLKWNENYAVERYNGEHCNSYFIFKMNSFAFLVQHICSFEMFKMLKWTGVCTVHLRFIFKDFTLSECLNYYKKIYFGKFIQEIEWTCLFIHTQSFSSFFLLLKYNQIECRWEFRRNKYIYLSLYWHRCFVLLQQWQ